MIPKPKIVVDRLIELQRQIRQTVIDSRTRQDLHHVDRESEADTIYTIDALVEPLLIDFCRDWSRSLPLVLIAEGIDGGNRVFPEDIHPEQAAIQLIVDPIDGTRGLMYDKRSAWSLAGVAPNHGTNTRLKHIEVAVMTELPTRKMGYCDVLSAMKGKGATARRIDLSDDSAAPLAISPSTATTLSHGFASVVSFFPGTKVIAGDLVEELVRGLTGRIDLRDAAVFDDQYICTGGQFYELIVGHDRFIADLRPRMYGLLRQPTGLCCHPYDCCSALIATEAGIEITDGFGQTLDGPLDCTTSLSWVGYANASLRRAVQPLIEAFFRERLSDEAH